MTGVRIGVDIGGTFTDATMVDEAGAVIAVAKVPTTPRNLASGFFAALDRLIEDSELSPSAIDSVVHATTAATNALIEGTIGDAAFVTTAGFRDVLEIGRQNRPSLYDVHFQKPRPLVPRDRCFGVPERIAGDGSTIEPLDEASVQRLGVELSELGVSAVAICFLHAYRAPEHEHRAAELLRDALGTDIHVSVSSRVAPEFREYVRASTTVVNACLQPVVHGYLRDLESGLHERDVRRPLLVMQSSGGVISAREARERPVTIVESGPAAGVVAGTFVGKQVGSEDLMTFDMGGTTAKASLVIGGQPLMTREYEVGTAAGAAYGAHRGSGYPISTPVVDLVEVGAGGGSIAWIDDGGALQVGPRSAGAEPGPVCYSRGGVEPTVTDANLVLGRINAAYFLGGEMPLDVEAAAEAIDSRCAAPLSVSVEAAAHAIVEIANARMVNALRLVSIERGFDPRDFVLVAFGGAGPVHVNRLAAELSIPTVIVPTNPGTASATGLVITEERREYATTLLQLASTVVASEIEIAFTLLEQEARQDLRHSQSATPDAEQLRRELDLRYHGQSHELTIPASSKLISTTLQDTLSRFHDEHRRAYGSAALEAEVEIVNVRVVAFGKSPLSIAPPEPLHAHGSGQPRMRDVYFDETGGFTSCAVFERATVARSTSVTGPAIVEEMGTSTVIHPGYQASIDSYGNLVIAADHSEVALAEAS